MTSHFDEGGRSAMQAPALAVLCAGAAQGLVSALQTRFEAQMGALLALRFGAVGALKEALLAGQACDVMIVTDAMLASLVGSGQLLAGSRAVLGRVSTALAVREGETAADISSTSNLRQVLQAAKTIHFPDPVRATAGIHFVDVLRRLGIHDQVADQLKTYPNGATAMRALAASSGAGHVGCTQASEILFTPGLRLLGALPAGLALATTYSAAQAARTHQTELASAFVELLAGAETLALRTQCGFEFASAKH